MKINILSIEGKVLKEREMPKQLNVAANPDLIKRAVLAEQANKRQAYGSMEDAGKRASTYLSKRRRKYRGTYGIGQSRTPRKVMSRRGERINYVGAFAPQTVGGREAHPPKPGRIWDLKINKKEKLKAMFSAIRASLDKKIVAARGHNVPENYPFVIESKIEEVAKTKDVKTILEKVGLNNELSRLTVKIRAGKGKMRNRKYRENKGPLIIVSKDCNLLKSARNLLGVEVIKVNDIRIEHLAPGAAMGRLTIFSEEALNHIPKVE